MGVCCVHLCGRHYLVPLVLLLFHSEDGVYMVLQQLIRQLTHTGMILKNKTTNTLNTESL